MMQPWFEDAKLGIFVHWGLYSVNGIPESWSFYNGEISYEEYMHQAKGFTAARYDAKEWAALFAEAGARYAVLTAKHHDGFALWDTAESDISAPYITPAAQDLVAPYCEAMRGENIRVGLYFSHLDWSHPDNNAVEHPDPSVYNLPYNPLTHNGGKDDPARWKNFLRFHRAQLKELLTGYGPIDLLWFDGDWEKSAEQWDMAGLREYLHSLSPHIVLNSRMHGYGDYETPEMGFPTADPAGLWEYGITMNDSWGYQVQDTSHKPVSRLVRIFTEIIGRGGNMLLAVGPRADGSFLPEQARRLREFGTWLRPVAEAVYGTRRGLDYRHYLGASTLSPDGKTLYLFAPDKPCELFVKGIKTKLKRATLLAAGTPLVAEYMLGAAWNGVPPTLWLPLPEDRPQSLCDVVKLEFTEKLETFVGAGGAIAFNP